MLLGAEVEGKPGRWAFPRESGGCVGGWDVYHAWIVAGWVDAEEEAGKS